MSMSPQVKKRKPNKYWPREVEELRKVVLECDLTEETKWGQPAFTFDGKNICVIGELKKAAVLGFFKGALLDDTHHILDKPGKSTQSARYIGFTSVAEINKLKPVLKKYIYKAIEIEEKGLKVEFKKDLEPAPEELLEKFRKMPKLKEAFYSLTPGRQRAYIIYFSQAKQAATRIARIDKYTKQILDGVGLNDHLLTRAIR